MKRLGVDPRVFRLLVELFEKLSERRDYFAQLGRGGVALRIVALIYCGVVALLSLILALAGPAAAVFSGVMLTVTTLILVATLLPETSNTLINPGEATLLAHYPIDGATYRAAKLTHIGRILLLLVPALNLPPALGLLLLPQTKWEYPFLFFGAAALLGIVVALGCCALFGLMLRFVGARYLRAVAEVAEMSPWLLYLLLQITRPLRQSLKGLQMPVLDPWVVKGLVAAFAVLAMATVGLGLRSLSLDAMTKVWEVRRTARGRALPRLFALGGWAARLAGGQAGRAAYEYSTKMLRRDWQLRKLLLPLLIYAGAGGIMSVAAGLQTDPFSGEFSALLLAPHLLGLLGVVVSTYLGTGSDWKGGWVFVTAPGAMLDCFARGVLAAMWLNLALLPHVLLAPFLFIYLPAAHAWLFLFFSLGLESAYVAAAVRLVESVPFSRPVDPEQGAMLMPVMIASSVVAAVLVALQYFLLFPDVGLVAGAGLVFWGAAFVLARYSTRALAASMRFHLQELAAETGTVYREVDL